MPRSDNILCECCGVYMTRAHERSHRAVKDTPYSAQFQTPTTISSRVAAVLSISDGDSSSEDDKDSGSGIQRSISEVPLPTPNMSHNFDMDVIFESNSENDITQHNRSPSPETDLLSWHNKQVSDSEPEAVPITSTALSDEVLIDDDDEPCYPDWERFEYGEDGLSAWDKLGESYEREAALIGGKLSAYDRAICRAFSFKLQTHLTDKGYAKAPLAFQCNPPLPKIDALHARVAFLAGFKPERYDCCPNSCCCYTGPREPLKTCPHCLIPGPKKPIDIDSFLWPAIVEFIKLAHGVAAFDILESEMFALRAFLILVFSDIPAVSLLMCMKGHNGFSPCRMCKILGVRIPDSRVTTHYVPHDRSRHPDVKADRTAIKVYDMANLPMRSHTELLAQANEVQQAPTNAAADRLSRLYGIKGVPILSYLPSLKFPTSFPYDFMHLIWENLIKNMILHWTGDFKGLDEGSEAYTLPKGVWEAIGLAAATSGDTIPSAYGARVPNIAADSTTCNAEMWSFWTLYLGPVLLRRRFQRPKYFRHFVRLVQLLNICLQFEITKQEIEELRQGFIQWVKDYESIYYQFKPERVPTCPVTIHALLHIADSIEALGPVWCYWAFPMERYCGKLQPALRSRRFPYASLDQYVVEDAQLTQIKLTSNLAAELSLRILQKSVAGMFSHPSYPTCILLPPRLEERPPSNIINNICAALATRADVKITQVRPFVQRAEITQWGKVRRIDSDEGDTFRASSLMTVRDDSRNASFVRYEVFVDIHERHKRRKPKYELQTFYGELQHIFLAKFEEDSACRLLGLPNEEKDVIILAEIKSCVLDAEDSNLDSLDIHFYSKSGPTHIVDIKAVQCLVGRVRDGDRGWALIDRSGSLARAIALEDEE
ncbi:hypothetical protein NLJ89_g9087 [Agrocybe chaxingu]|uniref:Transposase family Tnp2 protein n=1 Tax=Agrocybe chaxingu TaxID=84603 RepID=A0A9W8JU66_9AGAR|nr:hypothetical protein NLJ89_g9087 [Agrocybe chaxingu]